MKTPFLKCSACLLVLLMAAAPSLQAQESNSEDRFIKQGTILTGISVGFTASGASETTDIFNAPERSNHFAVTGIQLDALYFITDHIGVGPLLSYQSLYTHAYYDDGEYHNEWSWEYGIRAGGYVPVQTIFGGRSRSQIFLTGSISWLTQPDNTPESYNWGYQIGLGTLLPVGEQLAVELALNYLARNEDKRRIIVCLAVIPCNPPPMHETTWHRNITLSVGLNIAL